MGIINKDRYDAFFSYAHDDAVYFKGWHNEFHNQLKDLFRAAIRRDTEHKILEDVKDREPTFFWDETGLSANGPINDELEEKIGKSEFLFVFIGMKYLESDFCSKEVGWFTKRLKDQGKKDEEIYKRIFIIVMEDKALQKSWGEGFLSRAKDEAKYLANFIDDKSGEPIPALLPCGSENTPNELYNRNLREVAGTLVERTVEILSSPSFPLPPDSPIPSTPQRVKGVVIGLVNSNLENATAELEKNLRDSGIPVVRITLEDLNSQEADEIIQAYLSNSALFIQPFDYGKVQCPSDEGGHLSSQEKTIQIAKPTVLMVYWQVSPELGGIEAAAFNAENRIKHTPYLKAKSQTALNGCVNEVVQHILDKVDPKAGLATIYIENPIQDEKIMRLLGKQLEHLWKDKHGTRSHLVCRAMPWDLLREAKEDLLEACHGIIMIYGYKDQSSLLSQIAMLDKKMKPGSKRGQAVAWAPPRIPRAFSLGYPINFSCEPTPTGDGLKEDSSIKDFLDEVSESFG